RFRVFDGAVLHEKTRVRAFDLGARVQHLEVPRFRPEIVVGEPIYDYGPERLLSLNHRTEGRSFYLFDALGSPVALTASDGSTRARYRLDAWGNTRSETGSSWNPFSFTGYEKDESGLLYAKARFYDPELGRFDSEDPVNGSFNNPPSLHKYLYAFDDPTVYTDPTGQAGLIEWARKKLQEAKKEIIESASDDPNKGLSPEVAGVAAGVVGAVDSTLGAVQVATDKDAVDRLGQAIQQGVTNAAKEIKEDPGGFVKKVVQAPAQVVKKVATAAVLAVGAKDPKQRAENVAGVVQLAGEVAAAELTLGAGEGEAVAGAESGGVRVGESVIPASGRDAAVDAVRVGDTESVAGGAEQAGTNAALPEKTLVVPREKAANFAEYQKAAEEGTLVRTDPSTVRGSGFRKRLVAEKGPPPGPDYHADHTRELCVGGPDCAKTNGQWLKSTPNVTSGSKIGAQVKKDPIGTKYTKVVLEPPEQ